MPPPKKKSPTCRKPPSTLNSLQRWPKSAKRPSMKKSFLLVMSCSALLAATAWASCKPAPPPSTVAKVGSCPNGYTSDGNYCRPHSNSSMFVILKDGSCPNGYTSDGSYCRAHSKDSCLVIPKSGSCPNGFTSDGNYCRAH